MKKLSAEPVVHNRSPKFDDVSRMGGMRRSVNSNAERKQFFPYEDWHDPTGKDGYKIITKEPGKGFRHVVTPDEITETIDQLPNFVTRNVDVIQLSTITKAKKALPCYGMQWGTSVYLYPIEEDLVEIIPAIPDKNLMREELKFGARLKEVAHGVWMLQWTEKTIKDFYRNFILPHELGHTLDTKNRGYRARETFADQFAQDIGYPLSEAHKLKAKTRKIRKRHHST